MWDIELNPAPFPCWFFCTLTDVLSTPLLVQVYSYEMFKKDGKGSDPPDRAQIVQLVASLDNPIPVLQANWQPISARIGQVGLP